MKLVELLNKANEGYPDGYLAVYFDVTTGRKLAGKGDTLAKFVVSELTDTFDPEASDDDQIAEAAKCLRNARYDLASTVRAFGGRLTDDEEEDIREPATPKAPEAYSATDDLEGHYDDQE